MKISKMLLSVLAGSLALTPAIHAAPLRLDFGTAKSPVFPGFTRVSNQDIITPDAKLGFVKSAPRAYNNMRPNALAGDFVYSSDKSTFQVNLPDGKYKAWFLYGHSRYGQRVFVPLPMKYQISINGKTAVSDPINGWQEFYTEKYFYRGYSYIYHANDDFYTKYVAPNFKEATVDFDVTGGKVLFTLEDIPLNAMVIYAADDFPKVDEDIAYLRKELRRYTIINEAKPRKVDTDPEYSAADQKQGFVTYSRYPTAPPRPADRPVQEELNASPSTFVSQGQTADLAVSILPLQDLKDVQVTVSELVDKDSGAKLSATVQYIALQEVTVPGSHRTTTPAYEYEVRPTYIKPFPTDFPLMEKGVNRTVLVTVKTDTNTKAGIYEGTLNIAPQNAPTKKVLLKVRVLPFALPELPIIAGRYASDSVYYYNYYWSKLIKDKDFEDFVWAKQRERMQWVKDMGLNSIAWSDDMRGDILTDPIRFDPDGRMIKWMDLYRDMGFKAMPWYGFQALTSTSSKSRGFGEEKFGPEWTAKYRQFIEYIRDEGKRRHWPEIIFYLSDELSNKGPAGGEEGLKRIAASDNIPGIRRIMSMNGRHEHVLINKNVIAMPNYAFPITAETLNMIKEKGAELWLYNVQDNRFSWGYYPFLTQAKGRFQWFQSTGNCLPFDDFDANAGDTVYSYFVAGPNGPVTKINALDMREGLDDLRYLTLMKTLMQGKDTNSKGMQDANAILKEIEAMDVDLRSYASGNVDATETGFESSDRLWSPEKCDKMRWRIAEAIMELQKG